MPWKEQDENPDQTLLSVSHSTPRVLSMNVAEKALKPSSCL